jgi:hypothetical protein
VLLTQLLLDLLVRVDGAVETAQVAVVVAAAIMAVVAAATARAAVVDLPISQG